MTETLSARLAARFEEDARALRIRAEMLAKQQKRGGGPDAAACEAMAGACDRVRALFAGAADDVALAEAGPQLERMLEVERSADARHVYAGAIARLRQSLDDTVQDEDDDEDDDDELDD
jgi:hypothetical protein